MFYFWRKNTKFSQASQQKRLEPSSSTEPSPSQKKALLSLFLRLLLPILTLARFLSPAQGDQHGNYYFLTLAYPLHEISTQWAEKLPENKANEEAGKD